MKECTDSKKLMEILCFYRADVIEVARDTADIQEASPESQSRQESYGVLAVPRRRMYRISFEYTSPPLEEICESRRSAPTTGRLSVWASRATGRPTRERRSWMRSSAWSVAWQFPYEPSHGVDSRAISRVDIAL